MGKILTSAARCGEGFMEEREEIASSQCCLGKGDINFETTDKIRN